ncbi:MAG: glutamate synthase subunit beta [Vicinamibacterales bacterium]
MGKPTGFIEIHRKKHPTRPVDERVQDWREVYVPYQVGELQQQASRCMDCGVPFCHQGCPLGNLIPDWNDLIYRDRWRAAIDRLHATNNFPEFTGRLCPAPCEGSCVLGINDDPVTIKAVEVAIIDRAFDEQWVTPNPPTNRTWKKVAVIGSGPAGLAAADQLNRAGHLVTVFERADRIGGLLRYGIPEFKMEKAVLDRRLSLLRDEGIVFRTGVSVGSDVPLSRLRAEYDAVLLAAGACQPRDLTVPGRQLHGVHFAMEYLTLQNRRNEGDQIEDSAFISARGKHVIIIGGGDTGADCLGTAHRQGAKSVMQLELMPTPPETRADDNPWPQWPQVFRVSPAHEEGGERLFSVSTVAFEGDAEGCVRALRAVKVERVSTGGRVSFQPVEGSEFEIPAELVLLAMGFSGPERGPLVDELSMKITDRGNVWRDKNWMTSIPGIFTAGDMQRGQSLIVWAIAEGRSAARAIDHFLMGESFLPAPLE